jgi:citrate lyase beta subunit
MALIETPKGILNLREIITASERVVAVGFGAGDFSREMGAGMGVTKLSPEEYFPMVLFARSSMATTAGQKAFRRSTPPFSGWS